MSELRDRTQGKQRWLSALVCVALLILAARPIAAQPAIAPGAVRNSVWVDLQALPSRDCFPASSLQQSELEEDFARLCPNCRLVSALDTSADFRIVVQDPGLGWRLFLFDRDGKLVRTLEWEGPLELGLTVAILIIRDNLLISMGTSSSIEVGWERDGGHGPRRAFLL